MKRPDSPLQAIRHKCAWCCAGDYREADACPASKCPLRPFRMGKKPEGATETPRQAIRRKCLYDCGEYGSVRDVTNCPIKDCPVYHLRSGKQEISDKQRAARSAVGKRTCVNLRVKPDTLATEST